MDMPSTKLDSGEAKSRSGAEGLGYTNPDPLRQNEAYALSA